MPIPDYQTMMRPVLQLVADGQEHAVRDLQEAVADHFELTPDERAEMQPKGNNRVLVNRLAWARIYLVRAGTLEAPRRGVVRITDRGRQVLQDCPDRLTAKWLKRFPEFADWKFSKSTSAGDERDSGSGDEADVRTPTETIELAFETLNDTLAEELLDQVKGVTPAYFEQLVVDVLVAMGYGGSAEGAARVLGRGGDGGVDGVIKEDRLGLDAIYVQAKKWEGSVGRPEIQKFVGALQGQRSRKGVFITTSTFTAEARAYAEGIESRVVLIDGRRLAELMIEHDVGVSSARTYEVKRIDSDYFLEE